ncbi:MAG: sodium-translocating pyrophosphatase [Candidatus Hodarchaeota archaeon]
MEVPSYIFIAIGVGILSILIAIYFAKKVIKADPGNERMQEVAGYIEAGAGTFLRRQYITLAIFVGVLTVVLFFLPSPLEEGNRHIVYYNWEQSLAYVIGAVGSMIAGWLGMKIGVKANTRSAQACSIGPKEGFDIAFFGGAVMGLAVVGIALIGVSILYILFLSPFVVLGFSFGASSVALFMKCGGGIYTKTADVGADLVGKAEYKLPEDDPRNPATIADNVGDNVGDIAGMGSDLFDSYVASIVAAMILAAALVFGSALPLFVILPIVLCGVGLFASLIGIFIIKWFGSEEPGKALNTGTYLATVIFAALGFIIIFAMSLDYPGSAGRLWRVYLATVVGLLSGMVIGFTSDYYTRDDRKPTRAIAHAAEEGDAVVILSGFSYGLISVVPPAIGIVIAMAIAYMLDGVFGVGMAAVGMLAVVGTIVANDAYGPIVDNSRAIAEQGDLGDEVIRTADRLDSAGNTAKAITKGFAIGAANLTVLALMFSFAEESGIELIDLISINVLIGAFLGVVAPALFSALLILAVQRNAGKMVREIRRQFDENPKILTGEEAADFNKCIDIATRGALRELIFPSIISIVIPIVVGILFGVAALGAFLAGAILSGFVFAILMSNAGGSWDNAKKWIEDGNLGGKGTDTHKASITGDTVGDPFKDTAGPSINTLLVVMSLTASIFMGFLLLFSGGAGLLTLFL